MGKTSFHNMALEFIERNQIRINGKDLALAVIDPPFKDGNSLLVEATSDTTNTHQQKLFVGDLQRVLGNMLPKGFQITIYRPEAQTKGLDFVAIENLLKGCRLTVIIGLSFQSWEQRLNLIHFSNHFCVEAERTLPKCHTADMSRSEVGVSISCSFEIQPNDDCYQAFQEADRGLSELYKQLLKNAGIDQVSPSIKAIEPTEGYTRWWVRYAIVPLLSGGVGAALVAWLLSNAGKT
ncbi:MAG: hypothetical protein KZQ96_20045 [Candidatus Thiodiazotropha sp. (ex Lucinoma borealis)]|nr:hypothetical protein [Candidatus Thiodiazotropha sp. (ex Lucinoma borealis)]